MLEQVLGEHVPSAPPNVPALDKQNQQLIETMTLRKRFELHRADSTCANCHQLLDPIGFGLENFDAIGRCVTWMTMASRSMPQESCQVDDVFSSPQELKAVIAERIDDFSALSLRNC